VDLAVELMETELQTVKQVVRAVAQQEVIW
jgi:hypothetical protein